MASAGNLRQHQGRSHAAALQKIALVYAVFRSVAVFVAISAV